MLYVFFPFCLFIALFPSLFDFFSASVEMSLHVCINTGPSVLSPCSISDLKWPYYGYGQNPGFSVSLRYSKRKSNLKALYGPPVLSSSTMTSPFIPFLIRKLRTPSIVVSWVIFPRYIHAFFFSALISLYLDVTIMTCCRCLLGFGP